MEKLMQGVYKYDITVLGFNCDMQNKAKLSYIMKEIQQMGNSHLDSIGITYSSLLDKGYIFMLSKIALKINRMPREGEKLTVVTTPQGSKGASMLRKIQFGTESGEVLIDTQTAWLLIDPIERKILKPKVFEYTLPCDESEPDNINVTKISIKSPNIKNKVYTKTVKYCDMDVNNHMNNTVYGDVVLDAIPFDVSSSKEIDTMVLYYRKEALFNQSIDIYCEESDNNLYLVEGELENEVCFTANIKFK